MVQSSGSNLSMTVVTVHLSCFWIFWLEDNTGYSFRRSWQQEMEMLLSRLDEEKAHVKGLLNDVENEKQQSKRVSKITQMYMFYIHYYVHAHVHVLMQS